MITQDQYRASIGRILRRTMLFGVTTLLAIICPLAIAQSAPSSNAQTKLLSVDATGSHLYSSAQVLAFSGMQLGSPVSHDTIQAGADRLAASGLFASVRYRYATDEGGLHVTFELQDAPTFPVLFDNFPWFSDDDLSKAIIHAGIPFQGGVPAAGTDLDFIAKALEQTLANDKIQGTVSHQLTAVPGTDQKTVRFSVSGADVIIHAVTFSDSLVMNDRSIGNYIPDLVGKPFSRQIVERFDFEHLRPVYFKSGYLHVQFGNPQVHPPDHQGFINKSVDITIPIEPGAIYTWAGVEWTGNRAYTTEDLDTLVKEEGLLPGQPADGMKIFELWQSVQSAYGHRGYLDEQIQEQEAFDDANHRAAYHVVISEGPQYRMGDLVLTGLSPESERRLRGAWRIPKGQVFDETYYESFLNQGIQTLFKGTPTAQDKIGRYLQKNPAAATVDVMIDFQ
ncbi:MAG TPA: POTRA domain-containing protein [Candidatus Acidoferrales bacterium]|nr:POTRA domain-containing protein [Candidatus Acidoferrales bacterium]